jgi:CBS domain-containing protein/mannitol/fructose-specific phosphotransferase system IIA component (Ntr-type)
MTARHLAEFLTPDRIVVPLEARTYADAVRTLLDPLDRAGCVRDRAALERELAAQGARGVPTIGRRVLYPHVRSDAAATLGLALGVAREPFPFAPEDAAAARILVLVVAPRGGGGYSLKMGAALARLFRDLEVVERIEDARTPEEIAGLDALREVELTPELVVGDLMTRDVVAVRPETPVREVARLMLEKGWRAVPVVGPDGAILGVVTDRELLETVLPLVRTGAPPGRGALENVTARDVMRKRVLGITEDQPIADVAALMVQKDLTRCPVVSEGRLVGMLTRSDLVRKLVEPYVEPRSGS